METNKDNLNNSNNSNNLDDNKILDKEHDGVADDWMGRHNVFTRLITIVVIIVFAWVFYVPLAIGYAEIISYVMVFVLLIVTFGLNSLKVLGSLIEKWKK